MGHKLKLYIYIKTTYVRLELDCFFREFKVKLHQLLYS